MDRLALIAVVVACCGLVSVARGPGPDLQVRRRPRAAPRTALQEEDPQLSRLLARLRSEEARDLATRAYRRLDSMPDGQVAALDILHDLGATEVIHGQIRSGSTLVAAHAAALLGTMIQEPDREPLVRDLLSDLEHWSITLMTGGSDVQEPRDAVMRDLIRLVSRLTGIDSSEVPITGDFEQDRQEVGAYVARVRASLDR